MGVYKIFILLSLIILINTIDFCDLEVSASSPSDCTNLLKGSYTNYCCLFKGRWKGIEYSGNCMDLTPVRFNEMKEYIEEMNKQDGYRIDEIKCNSFYLKIGILYLAFFLL